jgi:hypothetical protein
MIKKSIGYFVGYLLSKSKLFLFIERQSQILPGVKDSGREIRDKSILLSNLIHCYNYYFTESLSKTGVNNAEFQKKFWDKEGYAHHTSKDLDLMFYEESFQKEFYRMMDLACGNLRNAILLDIGCGSFYHVKKSFHKYGNVFSEIRGVDISKRSNELCEAAKEAVPVLSFTNGNVLENKIILNDVDVVVSHSVLLYFDHVEITKLFKELKGRVCNGSFLIIEEPVMKDGSYYCNKLQHYHNYKDLAQEYGYQLVNIVSKDDPSDTVGNRSNAIMYFKMKG